MDDGLLCFILGHLVKIFIKICDAHSGKMNDLRFNISAML